MARIPDVMDLGSRTVPRRSQGIVQDQSAEISAQTAGQFAGAVGGIAQQFGEREDKFAYSQAKSALLQADIATRKSLENDPDWATYEARYQKGMGKALESSAKSIRGNRDRALFEMDAKLDIERGLNQIRSQAKAKEIDWGRSTIDQTLEANRAAALNAPDDASRQALLMASKEAIIGAKEKGYFSEQEATNVFQTFRTNAVTGYIEMQSPQKRVELLSKPKGTVAEFLQPDAQVNLLRQAQNEIRIERERAEAEQRSKMIEVRQALTDQLRDITVAAQLGLPVNVPSRDLLRSAFGEREGEQRYRLATKAAELSGDVASLQQLPTDQLIAKVESYRPGAQSGPGLLAEVYADYPGLSKYGFQFRDSIGKGEGRKLEFYPPGESYSPFEDKNSPGIERFDPSMGKADVFGEMLHYLPSADKKVGALRKEFQDTISADQKEKWLRGDYESQIKARLFGDKPPTFEQWLSKQGGDAFFRGYLTNQYPAEAYTQEQKELFGELDTYLRQGETPIGVADQAQLYGHIANSAREIIKQRTDDPAGYLTQFAPRTQAAWQVFQSAGTDESRAAYLAAVEADRERLGLPKGDILPNSYAKALAEEIANPKSAEQLASLMEAEAQRWGNRWPDVHAQIAKDIPDMAAVIGSGIDRTAAVTLASTAKLKDKELQAMLPPSVKWGDVQADVAERFADVRRSFPAEGARTWEAIRDSAVRLSVSYMQAGDSKDNAVKRAYKELIDKQYAIGEVKNVSFLVPRDFDAGIVEESAERFISEFTPTADMIAVPAGEDPSRFIPRATEAMRENAYWVSRGDGLGLRLYLGARPTSVTRSFQELQDAETARRAQEQADVARQREQATRARGPK